MKNRGNLILFGFKRCGKSHFGRLLHQTFELPFIDLDDLIEEIYFQKMGQRHTCREIALLQGLDSFRTWEKQALFSLDAIKNSVISLGGGTLLDPINLSFSLSLGKLVYLDLDKETVKQRILSPPLPSYLDSNDPMGSFEKMYRERIEHYERIPCVRVCLQGKTDKELIRELEKVFYGK